MEDRVTLAIFHLKGQARRWYQVLYNDEGLVDWERFKSAIIIRFGSSPYENHFGELTKLIQIGYVQDYIDAFEAAVRKTRRIILRPVGFLFY